MQEMAKVQRGSQEHEEFRTKLAAKFPEAKDRKKWIEETLQYPVANLNELALDEVRVLLALV
jgi:uncharacterized protein YdhG (YjbR/CyaY superfamily)